MGKGKGSEYFRTSQFSLMFIAKLTLILMTNKVTIKKLKQCAFQEAHIIRSISALYNVISLNIS